MSFQIDTGRSPYYPPPPAENGVGLAGFIVSLVGFLTCGCISPLGLFLSLIGACFAPRGFAIAGIVLGLIGSAWLWIGGAAIILGLIGANEAARKVVEAEQQRQAKETAPRESARPMPVPPPAVDPEPEPAPVIRFDDPPAIDEAARFREEKAAAAAKREAEARRVWSIAGRTVEGTFRGVAFGRVKIETPFGNVIEVPLSDLSLDDREWIRARAAGR